MRRYTLASMTARQTVDLRDFQTLIEDAVHEVLPIAQVTVYGQNYTVSPTPAKGEAIRIGRIICKSELGQHCVKIPKLFCSMELEEGVKTANGAKAHTGGHF